MTAATDRITDAEAHRMVRESRRTMIHLSRQYREIRARQREQERAPWRDL